MEKYQDRPCDGCIFCDKHNCSECHFNILAEAVTKAERQEKTVNAILVFTILLLFMAIIWLAVAVMTYL